MKEANVKEELQRLHDQLQSRIDFGEWGRVVAEFTLEAGHVTHVRLVNEDMRKFTKKNRNAK